MTSAGSLEDIQSAFFSKSNGNLSDDPVHVDDFVNMLNALEDIKTDENEVRSIVENKLLGVTLPIQLKFVDFEIVAKELQRKSLQAKQQRTSWDKYFKHLPNTIKAEVEEIYNGIKPPEDSAFEECLIDAEKQFLKQAFGDDTLKDDNGESFLQAWRPIQAVKLLKEFVDKQTRIISESQKEVVDASLESESSKATSLDVTINKFIRASDIQGKFRSQFEQLPHDVQLQAMNEIIISETDFLESLFGTS